MERIKNILLNSDEEEVLRALDLLDSKQIEDLKEVLVLLWQIHPNETIKEKTEVYINSIFSESDRDTLTKEFSVFKSIVEFFPWMGDYTELQQTNFEYFRQAKEPYEQTLVESSVLVEYYLDLGRKLYMMFDLEAEAEVCFEGVIKYNDTNDEALYALGRIAEHKKDANKALELYERCIANNENHIYGLLQLGMLKAEVFKDYEGAIVYYNKLIDIEPFMVETHVRIAEAHYALNDVKRAKQFIEVALGINEYHEEALNLLGQIQWHYDKDIEAAIETFEKGVDHKVHGDSGLLLASLGELCNVHLGEPDKARVYYEKSLKAKPKQEKTLRKLVDLLENIYQDYGAISMCYESYLMVEPNNASVYVDYAQFLIKYMHDYDFAKIQLDRALELEAENEDAIKILNQISDYVEEDEDLDDSNSFDDDNDNKDDDDDDDDDDFIGGGAAGDN